MRRYRFVGVLLVVGLAATACGRSGSGTASEEGPDASKGTAPTATSDCDGAALEATDIGVTADSITIQVMSDTGSSLAPGLFQGNIDALKAFETFVNSNGGIACRKLKVETWDSKLDPSEAKNGQISACTSALAMVGGNSLFNPDPTEMETCANADGQPVGLANVSGLSSDINDGCSSHTFTVQPVAEECSPQGRPITGVHDFKVNVGATLYYETLHPELKGLFLVPADLPSSTQSARPTSWPPRRKSESIGPQR